MLVMLDLKNEDSTLGYLLQEYLLEHKNITFASYNVPHPLEKHVIIKYDYINHDPLQEVLENILKDLKNVEESIQF